VATKQPKYKKVYNSFIPVLAYKMARSGMRNNDIAEEFGIREKSFHIWLLKHPDLKKAVELGRTDRGDGKTLTEWIYQRLDPELQQLWDKIEQFDAEPNSVVKIELLLQGHGESVRQQLFLHALVQNNFSPSAAMRKVNMDRRRLERWLNEDPRFAELVREVQWHKGNFFEEALAKLVKQGVTSAVLFANKTFNAKRGYATTSKLQVEHSGSIVHGVLDLAELLPQLSQAAQQEILSALRQREERIALEHKAQTVEGKVAKEISELATALV
jgi:hypothetical protein